MTNIIMHLSLFIVSGLGVVSLKICGFTTLIVAPVFYSAVVISWLIDSEYRETIGLRPPPMPFFGMSATASLFVISLIWEVVNG